MLPVETIFKTIESGGCFGLAVAAVGFLWKMDKRLASWDKKISVKTAECEGRFCLIERRVSGNDDTIVDHERRIDDVEDKILIIENKGA